MADILKIPRHRMRPAPLEFGEDGSPTIGSLLRRKLFLEGGPRPRGKRRLGPVAMRKARESIQQDAYALENALRLIVGVLKKDHDPRALAAMIEHWDTEQWNPVRSFDECEAISAMFERFMIEFRKRFPAPRPRLVK